MQTDNSSFAITGGCGLTCSCTLRRARISTQVKTRSLASMPSKEEPGRLKKSTCVDRFVAYIRCPPRGKGNAGNRRLEHVGIGEVEHFLWKKNHESAVQRKVRDLACRRQKT